MFFIIELVKETVSSISKGTVKVLWFYYVLKLSNSQLIKLKSIIKNGTEVTLNFSSNLIGNSNDETNFPHKWLLTDTEVSKIFKAFANGSSANVKFSKTQLFKIEQSGGFIPISSLFGSPTISKTPSEPRKPLIISYLKELKNIGA